MNDTHIPSRFSFECTVEQPEQTALELLAQGTGLSKQRIKDAMNKGAVWWQTKGKTLRLRRATKVLPKGTRLQFFYDEQVLSRTPLTPTCLLDAQHYTIWYKPHGMLAQGSQWGDHCSILRWVEVNGESGARGQKRECFLIHRLDAEAAGIMIIGHTPKSAATLSSLFQGRDIKKYYQAWVDGDCETGEQGKTVDAPLDGKSALTHLKKIAIGNNASLLEIRIETGRKHQIRRHLAGTGHPIIHDRLYGSRSVRTEINHDSAEKAAAMQLLAFKIEFECPLTKKQIRIELAEEMQFKNGDW